MTSSYAGRAREHGARCDAERRLSATLSRWRLATFLPAAAILIAALSGGRPLYFAVAAALFLVFGWLVVWQSRVEERAAWFDALRTVNLRTIARIERQWGELPAAEAPHGADLSQHPYALDLDLFGRASLFQWLGPAATAGGSERLADWLLVPSSPAEIRLRQAAVQELGAADDWRERFAAHGVLSRGATHAEIERFVAWAEGQSHDPTLDVQLPGSWHATVGFPLHATVLLLTAAIWILLPLQLTGVVDGAYWLVPLIAGMVLSFAMTRRIHEGFERAGAAQRTLSRYASFLEDAVATRFNAPRLADVQARLSAHGASAPACMRRLNTILSFAELRTGAALLHFPIQALTLWDFHVLFALDRWRARVGTRVRGWFEALADLDALSLFGSVCRDNREWAFPELSDTEVYSASALGHPLIPDARRVGNDVTVGPPGTLLLVTGSNMSGKSTMLRAIGLNAVLAQAGAPVCARSLRMPPADLQTSIRVQDSLELGLSYFMAALARLKAVVDAAERPRDGRRLLYLLDEILQGTNSAERGIAVRGVARHLLEAGAIGAMTTHDLNLASEEPLASSARLVHFTEIVDERGEMRFDYRLRDGLATSRNALRLMKLIGIDIGEAQP